MHAEKVLNLHQVKNLIFSFYFIADSVECIKRLNRLVQASYVYFLYEKVKDKDLHM